MRRLLGGLVVVVFALAMTAGTASATHSNGEGPDKDMVVGTAKLPVTVMPFGTFPSQQHLNAQADAVGAGNADGRYFTNIDGGPALGENDVDGPTLCLDVVGTTGVDRGLIENASGAVAELFIGFGVIGKHVDNGEPGAGAPADQAGGGITPPPGPSPVCNAGTLGIVTHAVEQGNYIVHDGI
jgi:hypothetical protein